MQPSFYIQGRTGSRKVIGKLDERGACSSAKPKKSPGNFRILGASEIAFPAFSEHSFDHFKHDFM